MYIYTDTWQFKFDFQEFFTYMFNDLTKVKELDGSNIIGPMDYQPMLERFRLRLLNNLQDHINPYYLDIRLVGRQSKNIMVTCMTDRHPAQLIEQYIKNDDIKLDSSYGSNKYQNFVMYYDTINTTHHNTKSPIVLTLDIQKLLHRENHIARSIFNNVYPFFFYDNGYTVAYNSMLPHDWIKRSFNQIMYKPNALYNYEMTMSDMCNMINKNLVGKQTLVDGNITPVLDKFYSTLTTKLQTLTGSNIVVIVWNILHILNTITIV